MLTLRLALLAAGAAVLAAPELHNSKRAASANSSSVSLQITTAGGGRNATSPILYGWMIEDISHSIEGGLYGELLMNRALQGNSGQDNPVQYFAPTLDGYLPVGDAKISLDLFHPLSDTITNALQGVIPDGKYYNPLKLTYTSVTIPANATGEVGFMNTGWWGMQVIPQIYNASTYVQPAKTYENFSTVTFSIRSNLTGETFVSESVSVHNVSTFGYTQLSTQLQNAMTAPNSNNSFYVTMDASEAAGRTFYFTFNSLFGETFKGRANGIRKDLGEAVYGLRPKFLRFPGGNNIEGQTIPTRWIWNETIGPLVNRKGRPGDWGYWNTNGFGFLEFLEWCEDMEMEPVMAIYAGYSLDGNSYPEDQMGAVLQAALDQIEYVIGDISTTWGAQRAADGHPEPFPLNYIELGNEDWFSSTYPYRFPILYNGIKAVHPGITLISTAYNEAQGSFNYTIDIPSGGMWDTHHYEEPQFFESQFDCFDNFQQAANNTANVTVFIGEYSVFQHDTYPDVVNFSFPADTHIFYPELISAIGEGIYLLGAERNPDVVKMTSYAPSLANLNNYAWTPNLITFTANPNETILSVSYQLEKLFNAYHGTETIPVTNTAGDFDPLWWAASIDGPSNSVYLKIINSNTTTEPLSVTLDAAYSSVNGSILTNPDIYGYNYLNNQTAIVPVAIEGLVASSSGDGTTFDWDVPPYSVSVIQFSP